jgi:hypothetical protein
MGRRVLIVVALVIGLAALWYYFSLQAPAGVETMGDDDDTTLQWIALATAVVSLLTSMVSLVKEVVSARKS